VIGRVGLDADRLKVEHQSLRLRTERRLEVRKYNLF